MHQASCSFVSNRCTHLLSIFRLALGPKINAVRGYGADVVLCPAAEREATVESIVKMKGGVLVHPSNEPLVIAGQGTLGLELLQDCKVELDAVVVSIGGGGMTSGVATAVRALSPSTRSTLPSRPAAPATPYRSQFTAIRLSFCGRAEWGR